MILTLSDIKINYDFENLIPKLTNDQFLRLEENMVAEGRAHDPLLFWEGRDILLDGHNRFRILKAHPEITWRPEYVNLPDEDACKEWIVKNALGQRNLTPNQWDELAGRLYNARKGKFGGKRDMTRNNKTGQFTASSENKNLRAENTRTAVKLAEELGVSHSKVTSAGEFVDGLDAAEKVIPGVTDRVRSGDLPAQKAEVRGWRKMTPEQIETSVNIIEERGSKKRKPEERELNSKVKDVAAAMYSAKPAARTIDGLLIEIDALGDSFIGSLCAMLKRNSDIVAPYDGGGEKVLEHIETIITKLNDIMKKGIENV